MSSYKKNYVISQKYPNWVKKSLAPINFADSGAMGQILANLDEARIEKPRDNNFIPFNNYNNSTESVNVKQISVGDNGFHNGNGFPRNYRRNVCIIAEMSKKIIVTGIIIINRI